MSDLSKVVKIYEETDVDIANALLSTHKCILLATKTIDGAMVYTIGYMG